MKRRRTERLIQKVTAEIERLARLPLDPALIEHLVQAAIENLRFIAAKMPHVKPRKIDYRLMARLLELRNALPGAEAELLDAAVAAGGEIESLVKLLERRFARNEDSEPAEQQDEDGDFGSSQLERIMEGQLIRSATWDGETLTLHLEDCEVELHGPIHVQTGMETRAAMLIDGLEPMKAAVQ